MDTRSFSVSGNYLEARSNGPMGCFTRFCIGWRKKGKFTGVGKKPNQADGGGTIRFQQKEKQSCASTVSNGKLSRLRCGNFGGNNMRELEEMIAEWRRSLRGRMREDVVDEIEDHLRQKFKESHSAHHDAQTAFATALREIGPPAQIAAEFAKVETKLWWPIKLGIAVLGAVALLLPGYLVARLHDKPLALLLGVHVFTITIGYVTVFTIGMFGSCFVLQRSFGELPSVKANRIARIAAKFGAVALVFTAVGIVLAAVWANFAWGRAWSNDPKELGGLSVLGWIIGFIAAERSGAVSAKTIMMLAIFGNVVVSCGWLGANFLMTHSEFAKAQWLALVCAHTLLFGIGLLPAGWLRFTKAEA
jgi:hypothetical protein